MRHFHSWYCDICDDSDTAPDADAALVDGLEHHVNAGHEGAAEITLRWS
jgi:hypothetical protein